MTISHDLNSNGYLINNEIWFNITADQPVVYFSVVLQNLANAKVTSTFVAYTDLLNSASVNIQSIVKSLFTVPNGSDGNYTKIRITITANDGTVISFTKDFIRAGNRTNDVNQNISPNQSLRLSEKLPVWAGFPVDDYYLSPEYTIYKLSLSEVTNIDYRRSRGCNNIYVKFLNQKGGYSYWLFESYGEKETGSGLGYLTDVDNKLLDLGSQSLNSLNVYSKIPKEYRQYAKDVVISQDIYVYKNASWKKVFTKNNSLEVDNIKKVYSVTFNFDLNYRFNPSLLWSN